MHTIINIQSFENMNKERNKRKRKHEMIVYMLTTRNKLNMSLRIT
jgi:hypothetical protein